MKRSLYSRMVYLVTMYVGVPLLLILMVLCLATESTPASAATPTTGPTSAPTKVSPAEAMAMYIKVIKTDKDPSVLLVAYTQASRLNRMDPQLNSTYMRRMVLLGAPLRAYTSAVRLSDQDIDAGLAWAARGVPCSS